jgi:hypothetical protein
MDTIWNVAFGVDKNMQNDMENEYFYKCEKIFANSSKRTYFTLVMSIILLSFSDFFNAKYSAKTFNSSLFQ